jgi:hypothetical protein
MVVDFSSTMTRESTKERRVHLNKIPGVSLSFTVEAF